ncbi:hypothetical protein SAMN05216279_11692 [Pseudomonas oryzihabitans]|uniref:Uncharacterized protein n=1 Tax=Pseudomonas oryzihabitans TaxID=47885 RepID=A0A1G5PE50_9PSED|nr:hypothetical protein SAMN05216279_11692 [Pseudomonas psychrotolerans]
MMPHNKGGDRDEECENPTDTVISMVLVVISVLSLTIIITVSICMILI